MLFVYLFSLSLSLSLFIWVGGNHEFMGGQIFSRGVIHVGVLLKVMHVFRAFHDMNFGTSVTDDD